MRAPDVSSLRQFYHSPLGKMVARRCKRALQKLWPELYLDRRVSDATQVLGIGFAQPYLKDLLKNPNDPKEAKPSLPPVALSPANLGVAHWPNPRSGFAALGCLGDEYALPFADHSFDRILLCHVLELTEQPEWFLDEVWRVLKPSGRLLVCVPNRMSIWARSDATPFGYGRPYTVSQLEELLEETRFTCLRTEKLLFIPPTQKAWLLKPFLWLEKVREAAFRGLRLEVTFPSVFGGGLILLEAEKRTFAMLPAFKRHRRLVYAAGAPEVSSGRSSK